MSDGSEVDVSDVEELAIVMAATVAMEIVDDSVEDDVDKAKATNPGGIGVDIMLGYIVECIRMGKYLEMSWLGR